MKMTLYFPLLCARPDHDFVKEANGISKKTDNATHLINEIKWLIIKLLLL